MRGLQDRCQPLPTPQGKPQSQQAQPLGAPLVDELLGDSFLRRITAQFFQMLHDERLRVAPQLAEQVDLLFLS
jgi:hypothetical protein